MLIDDENDILLTLRSGLKSHGFEVAGFSDPIQALQHFENGGDSFNVVISDIRMPKMSGFQLARRIKELHPDIKIILMSAFEINRSEFHKVLPSTQVDSFISKPFSLSELVQAITALDRTGNFKEK